MNKTTKGERRGLFDAIFGKPKALQANSYFKLLNGYTPVFTNAPEASMRWSLPEQLYTSSPLFAAN